VDNFWTTFLAMFLALYVMHEIENYRNARKRNKTYCHKKAIEYAYMERTARATGVGGPPEQYAGQREWWEKQSKSLIPLHPTQK